MPKKKVENETEMPIDETKSPDDETKTKDLNESALKKVEDKFEEQNVATKESSDILVPKESHYALVLAFQDENGTLPPDDLLVLASHQVRELREIKESEKRLTVVLNDSGWDGQGSALDAAREIIISQNAELQVLDTTLIANLIKEPDSKIHPIEAAVRFINNYQKKTDGETPNEPVGRLLAEGTKLQIGGEPVVLAQETVVNYPDENNEQKFVGMCVHSENLELNQHFFRFRYSGFGVRLGLEEQVDDPADLPRFIAQLTEEEANSFGISSELWEQYQVKN